MAAATLLLILAHANRWAASSRAGCAVRPAPDDENEAVTQMSADRRVLVGLPVIGVALVRAAVAATPPRPACAAFDPGAAPPGRGQPGGRQPLAGVQRQLQLDPPASCSRCRSPG